MHHDQVVFISDMKSEFNICKSVKVIHPRNKPITWKEKTIISIDVEKALNNI